MGDSKIEEQTLFTIDTRHLLRTDGIKELSCGFSGAKKGRKFASARNRGRVFLF